MNCWGVCYDVGSVMLVNWRPDFDPRIVHRELQIIRDDLHCNAVRLIGRDVDRMVQVAERALAAQILAKGAKGGTAIVSRPSTGEILALANFTTDPETHSIVATGNNMGVTAVYEPGSVNKVITVAAALEDSAAALDHVGLVIEDQDSAHLRALPHARM